MSSMGESIFPAAVASAPDNTRPRLSSLSKYEGHIGLQGEAVPVYIIVLVEVLSSSTRV